MIELSALSRKLTVAPTGVVSAPPTRKKTSWTRSGSLADAGLGRGLPTESRTGELTGPASKMRPETLTPDVGSHHQGCIAVLRDKGGKALAEDHRAGTGTTIGAFRSYTPGVRTRSLPMAKAGVDRKIGVAGLATKNLRDRDGLAAASVPLRPTRAARVSCSSVES